MEGEREALELAIDGICEEVGMDGCRSIIQCLDEASISRTFSKVGEVLEVGA